jgi:acetolactate synthase I/II/III large subunit
VKLSDYVFQAVAATGVKHVFMLPGGGCMHLCDSLGRNADLTYICNLHEQACAIAADAYGQYTNNLGVALVTTGPGGTNAITGVAAAWLDSTPCLFLSGQVKRADMKGDRGVRQMGFQEIDIASLVRPITNYAVTVTDPLTIRYHLEKALCLARQGRPGPVWLDIPLDVQAAEISEADLRPFDAAELALPGVASPLEPSLVARAARQTVDWLKAAQRPVLLVGNGVRLDNALPEFQQLLARLKIPVLTTWKAADFLAEDHPLFAGRPGSVGQRGANFTQQNSDLLLVLGARLDLGQTGYVHRNFARGARKIIVDIDPAELGKLDMAVDLPVPCGAKAFLGALCAALESEAAQFNFAPWLQRCRDWKQRYPILLPEFAHLPDGISNYTLTEALSQCMTADDLLIPGSSGACSETTMQAFKVKAGQRVFNSEGLGPMGFGLPAAIGGCLASGGRRTISIDGDGGFIMNIQELEVVHRLNLPIKFFVLDNNGYNSIRQTQNAYFQGKLMASDPSSGLTLPDYRKVAEAFGIETCAINTTEEIEPVVAAMLSHGRPMVRVARISPAHTTSPRLSSGRRADGSMYSKPLEDLWPFLDRNEFLDNMIVPPVPEDKY